MPEVKTTILGNYKPNTFIHTGNVIMLKTKEHPNGFLHLIDETDTAHNSRSLIDLHTKKHINKGQKINLKELEKYKTSENLFKEMKEIINYSINISPLWIPKNPDIIIKNDLKIKKDINKCTNEDFDNYIELSSLREKMIDIQEKYLNLDL